MGVELEDSGEALVGTRLVGLLDVVARILLLRLRVDVLLLRGSVVLLVLRRRKALLEDESESEERDFVRKRRVKSVRFTNLIGFGLESILELSRSGSMANLT